MCVCLVTQSCLTLCDSMDSGPPGSFVHGDSPGKNTGVGCHAFLQGTFPAQRLNPGLSHCSQILYHLSHQECPSLIIILWKCPHYPKQSTDLMQSPSKFHGILHRNRILKFIYNHEKSQIAKQSEESRSKLKTPYRMRESTCKPHIKYRVNIQSM